MEWQREANSSVTMRDVERADKPLKLPSHAAKGKKKKNTIRE